MFFSDAVFAIAITLLVLEIKPPEFSEGATSAQWARALVGLIPHFADFVLSFLVIGAFWTAHHYILSLVRSFDPALLWPNLILLLFIAFLPFSTALISETHDQPIPFVFYGANLFFASLARAWLTAIALQPGHLAPGVPESHARSERRIMWIMPVLCVLAIALAFVRPGWNMAVLLGLPVLRRLPPFRAPAAV